MALRINQNIAAYNAHRNLTLTDNMLSKSLERLSSGLRINRAADDAAGLSISEKLRSQVRGLQQAVRNAQDGISLIQTAEGALAETHSILQRMRELAVQAANGTLTEGDRTAIQKEVDALIDEINRISTSTKFNEKALLDGTLGKTIEVTSNLGPASGFSKIEAYGATGSVTYYLDYDSGNKKLTLKNDDDNPTVEQSIVITPPSGYETITVTFSEFNVNITLNAAIGDSNNILNEAINISVTGDGMYLQVGAFDEQASRIEVKIDAMNTSGLGLTNYNLTDATGEAARALITAIDEAIEKVSTQRSELGAIQNRLEHTIANLGVAVENISASESRIRDVDMAAEMVNFTRQQIMIQAGTAMLAQANAVPQTVLQLLR